VPLYEYQCKKCAHRFERIVKFSDPPLKKCPQCGGAVEQLLSAPAAHFKGSGFYSTDYPKSGAGTKDAAAKDSAKSEKTDTKPEGSAESKPAKTESKPEKKSP